MSIPKFNVSDLKFDEVKYFKDYCLTGDEVMKDLIKYRFSSEAYTWESEIQHLNKILDLPIYRGYLPKQTGKLYVNMYKYNDNIYTEDELFQAVHSEFDFAFICDVDMYEVPCEDEYYRYYDCEYCYDHRKHNECMRDDYVPPSQIIMEPVPVPISIKDCLGYVEHFNNLSKFYFEKYT